MVVQRNLCRDDAEVLARLRRKQIQLERILDEVTESEPVKAEAVRELEAIYQFQKTSPSATLTNVQKVVRAVRRAIYRFHEHLANAVDAHGNPHAVLRPFAAHLKKHLIIPSGCHLRPGHPTAREEITGRFTYEPPRDVNWTS
jgi:hypothetical protein